MRPEGDVLDEEEDGSARSSASNSPREVGEAVERYQDEDSTRVCIVFLEFDVFFVVLCVSGMCDWYCCLLLFAMCFCNSICCCRAGVSPCFLLYVIHLLMHSYSLCTDEALICSNS
ncbi:hypothetical protein MUK42_01021 [Musa troglodytarum]|uniref:Uncharacterized protein n=1 Tax=Musa troglodytarum TaxID=320322 RepID=A0A9E7EXI9_9LILI|nr:hypothetical protein MUK42_01021 [Musa troglodytarum]